MKKLIPLLISLGIISITEGAAVGGCVRPSQLGDEMIGDTLKAYLSTGRCTLDVHIRGPPINHSPAGYFYNHLSMDPLPNEDDTVAFFEGVSPTTGAWIKVKNPDYTLGATCKFPDVAPTDAGGDHNVMIDMKFPFDETELSPYEGNYNFIVKRKDNPADSSSNEIDYWSSGYLGHISNLSFDEPPRHGDSLIAIVEKTLDDQKWRDSLIVEMDTTKYWAAFVVPDMTLNPEDSVISDNIHEDVYHGAQFELMAYPNPAHSSSRISCYVEEPQNIRIEIYDMKGRLVNSLWNGHANKGILEFVFDGKDNSGNRLEPGIYHVKLQAQEQAVYRRLLLIK